MEKTASLKKLRRLFAFLADPDKKVSQFRRLHLRKSIRGSPSREIAKNIEGMAKRLGHDDAWLQTNPRYLRALKDAKRLPGGEAALSTRFGGIRDTAKKVNTWKNIIGVLGAGDLGMDIGQGINWALDKKSGVNMEKNAANLMKLLKTILRPGKAYQNFSSRFADLANKQRGRIHDYFYQAEKLKDKFNRPSSKMLELPKYKRLMGRVYSGNKSLDRLSDEFHPKFRKLFNYIKTLDKAKAAIPGAAGAAGAGAAGVGAGMGINKLLDKESGVKMEKQAILKHLLAALGAGAAGGYGGYRFGKWRGDKALEGQKQHYMKLLEGTSSAHKGQYAAQTKKMQQMRDALKTLLNFAGEEKPAHVKQSAESRRAELKSLVKIAVYRQQYRGMEKQAKSGLFKLLSQVFTHPKLTAGRVVGAGKRGAGKVKSFLSPGDKYDSAIQNLRDKLARPSYYKQELKSLPSRGKLAEKGFEPLHKGVKGLTESLSTNINLPSRFQVGGAIDALHPFAEAAGLKGRGWDPVAFRLSRIARSAGNRAGLRGELIDLLKDKQLANVRRRVTAGAGALTGIGGAGYGIGKKLKGE